MKLDDFIDPFESVIWRGKPNKIAYLCWDFGAIPVALLILLFAWIVHYFGGLPLFEGPVIGFIVLGIGFLIVPPFWRLKKFPNEEYMLTNQRLIIKSGITKDDIWSQKLGNIKEIIVKKGVVGMIFGTAKIYPITDMYPYDPKFYGTIFFGHEGQRRMIKRYNIAKGTYEEVPNMVLHRMTQSHPRLEALNKPKVVEKILRDLIKPSS